jgi:FtsH-binding integral membrane protein
VGAMEFAAGRATAPSIAVPQGFMTRVFGWMVLGLLVTAASAGVIGASDSMLTSVTSNPVLLMVLFVAQLGLVVVISGAIDRLSVPVAVGLFLLYAALNGVIFAFVFELYTSQSIFTTFLVTASMFGAIAVYGATTKSDLTKLGPILFGALIALIVATVVNIFVASSGLYWITTYAGVIIFAGLTAYDMQKLTQYGQAAGPSGEQQSRMAIRGALALYLDFINLFLFLLRIFGRTR